MTALCIVTARGGSKRVPRKNVRPFMGRPLVAWPVRAAMQSGLFGQVLISTDDREIADAAVAAGAVFPFVRPAAVADDFSGTCDVLRIALRQWEQYAGNLPDYCCCLYGTSAFVTPAILAQAGELADAKSCVMAVAEYPHPIQRALVMDEHGGLRYLHPEQAAWRTQDCPAAYHDLGLLYYFSVSAFFACGARSFRDMPLKALALPRHMAVDIDTEADWLVAEALARAHGRRA